MQRVKLIFTFILGAFMALGGIAHFISSDLYIPFIPEFLNALVVNYIAGAVELALGIGLFLPQFRRISALGICLLMIGFLPIHVRDVFVDDPAIGSKVTAYIRLPFQFIFIAWPLWIRSAVRKK